MRFSIILSDSYQGSERLSFRRLEGVEVMTVTANTMKRIVDAEQVELILVQTFDKGRSGYSRYYRVTVAATEREDLMDAIDQTHRGSSRLEHGPVKTSAERTLEELEATQG